MISRDIMGLCPGIEDGLRRINHNHPIELPGLELYEFLNQGGCIKVVDGKLYACYNPDEWLW